MTTVGPSSSVRPNDRELDVLAASLRDRTHEFHSRLVKIDGLDATLHAPLAALLAHQHALEDAREHPSPSETRFEGELAKAANALRRVEHALGALPDEKLFDLFRPGGRLARGVPRSGESWHDECSPAEIAELRAWRERLEPPSGVVPDTLLQAWDDGFAGVTRSAFTEWLVLLVAAVVRTRRPSGALDAALVKGGSRTGWTVVADVVRVVVPGRLAARSCKTYEDRSKTRLATDLGPRVLAVHIDGDALVRRYAALADRVLAPDRQQPAVTRK